MYLFVNISLSRGQRADIGVNVGVEKNLTTEILRFDPHLPANAPDLRK